MCNKRNSTQIKFKNQLGYPAKVDNCLSEEIVALNKKGILTLASCCGHKKYHKTIVIKRRLGIIFVRYWRKNRGKFNQIVIPRKRRFYKKDKEGFYYIPEIT